MGQFLKKEAIFRQIEGVGEKYAKILVEKGVETLKQLKSLSAFSIETVSIFSNLWF
jgi:predicted flap endonuclease-1-like 5' DNA nuclease